MGTGKTCVGHIVADRLGMRFLDMDDVIVERAGKAIARIFAEDGEPHFRALERRLVAELANTGGLVIGAGGGIVLDPENVGDFARTGLVVCLSASPEAILARVASDTARPLLAGGDKMRKIADLLDKRRPLYEAVPCQVDTTGLDPEQVASEILAIYEDCPAPGCGT